MKIIPILSAAMLLTLPASGAIRWELSGTLNYVNPLLAGTFSVGQQFTISMDLDDGVPVSNGQRLDFYTSSGSFENAVANGSVTFPNYSAGCYVRDSAASGVTVKVEVAANLDFAADLGTTVVSTEDLGGGLERVCVRSNARFSQHTRQFSRLRVSEE